MSLTFLSKFPDAISSTAKDSSSKGIKSCLNVPLIINELSKIKIIVAKIIKDMVSVLNLVNAGSDKLSAR